MTILTALGRLCGRFSVFHFWQLFTFGKGNFFLTNMLKNHCILFSMQLSFPYAIMVVHAARTIVCVFRFFARLELYVLVLWPFYVWFCKLWNLLSPDSERPLVAVLHCHAFVKGLIYLLWLDCFVTLMGFSIAVVSILIVDFWMEAWGMAYIVDV